MSFDKLKNLRLQGGNIYSFDDYKIYMIPSDKLRYGISPIIDKFINKELNLSTNCKTDSSDIPNKYIYGILNKKETVLFFVTQTKTNDKEIWEDEKLDQSLIHKLESFTSINGSKHYNMNTNTEKIKIIKMNKPIKFNKTLKFNNNEITIFNPDFPVFWKVK